MVLVSTPAENIAHLRFHRQAKVYPNSTLRYELQILLIMGFGQVMMALYSLK